MLEVVFSVNLCSICCVHPILKLCSLVQYKCIIHLIFYCNYKRKCVSVVDFSFILWMRDSCVYGRYENSTRKMCIGYKSISSTTDINSSNDRGREDCIFQFWLFICDILWIKEFILIIKKCHHLRAIRLVCFHYSSNDVLLF